MARSYDILFAINLQHDYYAGAFAPGITIEPTQECSALLKELSLLYRMAGNNAVVLAEADSITKQPIRPLPSSVVFRFYINIENPAFLHITNWPASGRKFKFYAANLSENISEEFNYLTQPLATYSKNTSYSQGDLVVKSGSVFECLLENPSGNSSKPLTNKSFWRDLQNKNQYASTADSIEFVNNLHPLLSQHGSAVKLESWDYSASGLSNVLIDKTVDLVNEPGEMTRLAEALPPQVYKLTIDGNSRRIYYDNNTAAATAWGIVEIHVHPALLNSLQLLDSGKLARKQFNIRFRNRSIYWKYKLRQMDSAYTITDSGTDGYTFSKDEPNAVFLSDSPIPVSAQPLKTLTLKKNNTVILEKLRNPSADRLVNIKLKDTDSTAYLCSEIQLTI
jgi:hypothetical protein